jgi:hypothetical protein
MGLPQCDCRADLDERIGAGLGFPVIEDCEVAFSNSLEDGLKDGTIGTVGVGVFELDVVTAKEGCEVVPKVGCNCLSEAVSNESL